MSAPVELKYRAFLSYAHADMARGKLLHRQLEAFRIAKDLAGRETPRGPVPKTLRPIFRDREDFTGGHTLTDATVAALDASAALIVLCSPVAATRPAVNEEVRLFRHRHPDRLVIPVILDGIYPDNFPPALRFEIGPDGTVTDRPVTTLGPDLRETADGRTLSLAKIVAGLVGVGTDEIVRRAERDRQRRLRNWIVGLSTVIVALAGLTFWAEVNRREADVQRGVAEEQRRVADQRRQEAERNFALAKTAADSLVFDIAQGLRDVEGVRAETVTKILGTARGTFNKLADAAPDNLELQRSRAAMLSEFGTTYEAQGVLPAALESFGAALVIVDRLAKADPENAALLRDVAVLTERIGDVYADQGNLATAQEQYRASFDRIAALLERDTSSTDLQQVTSVLHNKMGDVLRVQGDLPAALMRYRAAFAVRERLAKSDPGNAGRQRTLSVSHNRIGGVLFAQGNLPEALDSLRASLVIAETLAKTDPGNLQLQRDSSIAHEKIGDTLRAQGNLQAAVESYRASLAIAERLVKADPGNAEWQNDLSVPHDRIGDILVAQGRLADALQSYQASLVIRERLATADPGNARWQHGIAISLQRIGLHGPTVDRPAAYRRGLEIMQSLVKLAPSHAAYKSDIAWFEARLRDMDNR